MVDATDMSTPVTRGELREEIAQLEVRIEQKLEQKLAHLATKTELELWCGALLARVLARIESGEQRMIDRMEALEQRMIERMVALEQRLLGELARHTTAIYESMSVQISVIDEKYADLPHRVRQLEAKVFTP
jgi:hypothetical protein